MNQCTIEGCTKPAVAKGMCHMHYRRAQRNGSPLVVQRDRTPRPCKVAGCARQARSQGMCRMHYQRFLRDSPNTEVPQQIKGGSLYERATRHIPAPDADGHQVWTSSITGTETPVLRADGTMRSARRLVWEHAHGDEPPRDQAVIATCGTERCVAPEHLELAPLGPPRVAVKSP